MFVYLWGWEYRYNVTLKRACNSRIEYMLYDDELYRHKSNKIYVMLYNKDSESSYIYTLHYLSGTLPFIFRFR